MVWIELAYNLALLIALSVVSAFIDTRWDRNTRGGKLLQGLLFGCAAMIGMLRPFEFSPGLIFDGRSVMISLGARFFGPLSAAVICLLTVTLRVSMGGSGTVMGVTVILVSALIGLWFHARRRHPSGIVPAQELLVFGILVHIAMLAAMFTLPQAMVFGVLRDIGLPVIVIYPLATVLTGRILSDQAGLRESLRNLRASEERYRDLFHQHAAVKLLVDPETGRIIDANAAAARFYGWSVDELRQKSITDINTLEPDQVRLEMQRADDEGRVFFQLRHRLADGSVRDVEVFSSTVQIDGRQVLHSIVHDVTELRKAELRLRQAEKLESIGRLAGGVAHDFNNLLMGIMNYVELCRDGIGPDHPVRVYLDEVTRDAERSAVLTRQLLAFARRQTIAPQVLDLNAAVVALLSMLRRLVGEDIGLTWVPGARLWPLKLDPGQVDQILMNLCANARDAIAGVGTITIETANVHIDADYCRDHAEAVPGDYVQLVVSDDGSGMDREALDQVFEPFFTTKGVGEGTGLGLATVYGVVRQNNGFVNVYSEPGRGTTFRIYLPRSEQAGTVPRAAPAAAGERPRGTETVLLVEDEKSIRYTTQRFLEQLGYSVLAAECPEQALRLSGSHQGGIDLLITDVVMPGMSGHDLAVELAETYPDMKCLYISGYTANVIVHRGVLDEAVAFLAKPFSRDQIALKVREVLDG
jgi:PAS domain S-box-containing protein